MAKSPEQIAYDQITAEREYDSILDLIDGRENFEPFLHNITRYFENGGKAKDIKEINNIKPRIDALFIRSITTPDVRVVMASGIMEKINYLFKIIKSPDQDAYDQITVEGKYVDIETIGGYENFYTFVDNLTKYFENGGTLKNTKEHSIISTRIDRLLMSTASKMDSIKPIMDSGVMKKLTHLDELIKSAKIK